MGVETENDIEREKKLFKTKQHKQNKPARCKVDIKVIY